MPGEIVSLPLANLSAGGGVRSDSLWGTFRALLRRGRSHLDERVQIWKSNSELDSLFIVALPRSLSSIIYQAARHCLSLQEPRWTSDGEFLNADRFVLIPGSPDVGQKYITRGSDGSLFTKISEFADQIVVPPGRAGCSAYANSVPSPAGRAPGWRRRSCAVCAARVNCPFFPTVLADQDLRHRAQCNCPSGPIAWHCSHISSTGDECIMGTPKVEMTLITSSPDRCNRVSNHTVGCCDASGSVQRAV